VALSGHSLPKIRRDPARWAAFTLMIQATGSHIFAALVQEKLAAWP